MERFKQWLIGYARLYISGSRTERFLSLLNNKDIPVWKVIPEKDGYTFLISRTNIRELDTIRRKTGTHIKVTEKFGLPYFLFRYRKRKALLLGIVLCAAIVYTGSMFIWDINVDGTQLYTEEQIKERIESQYVTFGQRKSEVNCEELEESLRADFPEISWISCEIIGTQLNVVIKETLEGTETIHDADTPQNIVAAKDGVIVEMITRSGTPLVKRGASIQKGDVLISGVVYIYDDYDEVLETDYVVADGDVIAETQYSYSDSFELQYYEKRYTGKHQKNLELQLFQWSFRLPIPDKNYTNYDEASETYTLRIGHTYFLPISLVVLERREYEPELCEYTEEDAVARMNQRLQAFMDSLSEKEVEIMENHVTIEVKDGVCSADGTIVVWERIGYGRPISATEASEE
jgi:similar to stage IV sporulation protein